jgi:hypothetical protein
VIEVVGAYKGQHIKTEADGATELKISPTIDCAATHYWSTVSNYLKKIVSKS